MKSTCHRFLLMCSLSFAAAPQLLAQSVLEGDGGISGTSNNGDLVTIYLEDLIPPQMSDDDQSMELDEPNQCLVDGAICECPNSTSSDYLATGSVLCYAEDPAVNKTGRYDRKREFYTPIQRTILVPGEWGVVLMTKILERLKSYEKVNETITPTDVECPAGEKLKILITSGWLQDSVENFRTHIPVHMIRIDNGPFRSPGLTVEVGNLGPLPPHMTRVGTVQLPVSVKRIKDHQLVEYTCQKPFMRRVQDIFNNLNPFR